MTEAADLLKHYLPWLMALAGVIVAGLFLMFRADNIRAGEAFPTKLAVSQTLSAIRNFRRLKEQLRGKDSPDDRRAPRVMTPEEMKATITPGVLRAEDIPKYPPHHPHRRKTPKHNEADHD